jgi:hypothetical protein
MKPRIEKKVSKTLTKILGDLIGKVWIDDQHQLHPLHWRKRGEKLSPKKERHNRNQRVRVNNMPVIGGEADYWGEYSEPSTVCQGAIEVFSWTFFEQGPEDEFGSRGYPVITEKMTGAWLIKKAHEYKIIKSKEQ